MTQHIPKNAWCRSCRNPRYENEIRKRRGKTDACIFCVEKSIERSKLTGTTDSRNKAERASG